MGDVAAVHLRAGIVQDLGDARQADAADADEMDGADVGRDAAHHLSPARVAATPLATAALREGAPTRITSIIGGAARDSTRSARSSVAFGRPQLAARSAASRSERRRVGTGGASRCSFRWSPVT